MRKRKPIIFSLMLRELQRFGKGLIAPDLVAAARIMQGTNLGSMNGLLPTGESIELRGVDFIPTAEGAGRRPLGGGLFRFQRTTAAAAGVWPRSPTVLSIGSKHLRWLFPPGYPSRYTGPIPIAPGLRRCSLASRRGKFPGKRPLCCRGRD